MPSVDACPHRESRLNPISNRGGSILYHRYAYVRCVLSEVELQVPRLSPVRLYGVRAMWSERSRHRRLGTAPGSLVGRLPSSPCVSCDVASATSQDTRCRATQSILYLGASSGTSGRSTRRV